MALFMGVAPAIDIAWQLLKNEPMHEMSNDDLSDIAFGRRNFDAGLGHYTPTENTATPEQQQQALRELELRQMEMSGNMPQVYDYTDDLEPVRQIVDFYEPQFDNKGIGDSSIPQTEKEGEQYVEDWPGELDEEYKDRIMDVREFIPGQSNISNDDYLGTYNHLKNTAPPEVAQQFLERYRDFIMRRNQNPEYLSQSLTQAFDENAPAPTAPKYTQEFPTDESLFGIKPPKGIGMVSPDATGFSHQFQDINKGEPMEIAMRLLKEDLFPHHKDLDYHLLSHDELAYLYTQGDEKAYNEIKIRENEFKETEANLDQYYKETGNHPESDFIDRDVPIRNLGRYSKNNEAQIMMPMTFTTEFEAGDDDWQTKNASEPMDIAWRLLKRQTTLPNFDMGLDETTGYQGVAPVQQVSAQPSQYSDAYLQGQYPDEFWSAVGSDPEITRGHGGSRHRADEQGNYLAVGVRGQQPVGDLPTRGPYRPRKGRAGYPQDMGVRVIPSGDMPEPEQIVTMPMRGGN
jgi:hypothetical protein